MSTSGGAAAGGLGRFSFPEGWGRRRGRELLLVAVLLFLAVLCRVTPSIQAPLWEDEVTTARLSNDLPVAAILRGWMEGKVGVDPPLYYVLARLTAPSEAQPGEWRFRLVSIVSSVVAVPAFYGFLRRRYGAVEAAVGGLLMAVNPFAVVFAREHRSYSLFLLASLLAYWAALHLADRRTVRSAVLFAGAAAFCCYSHLFGVFPVASLVLVLGVAFLRTAPGSGEGGGRGQGRPRSESEGQGQGEGQSRSQSRSQGEGEGQGREGGRRDWRLPAVVLLILTLAALPLLQQVLILMKRESGLGAGAAYENTGLYKEYLLFNKTNKLRDVQVWFSVFGAPGLSGRLVRYLSLLMVLAGIWVSIRRHWTRGVSVLAVAALSFTLALVAYEVLRYPYQSRRLIFLLPIYLFWETLGWTGCLAYCRERLSGGASRGLAARGGAVRWLPVRGLPAAALLLAVLTVSTWARIAFLGYRENLGRRDAQWREICRTIERHAAQKDAILFADPAPIPNFYQFRYYRDLLIPGIPLRQRAEKETLQEAAGRADGHSRFWIVVPEAAAGVALPGVAVPQSSFFGARLLLCPAAGAEGLAAAAAAAAPSRSGAPAGSTPP